MHANSFPELVPKRFRSQSGIEQLSLAIRDAWFRPFNRIRSSDGSPLSIPPSAFCTLITRRGPVYILVDLALHPALAESVLSLGRLLFTHSRADKYMTLYKVYEALEPSPALRFSAVRHGLSHHPAKLQRPGTVAELRSLFGATSLDLESPAHARPFYRRFAELLGTTDQLVASQLLLTLSQHRSLPGRSDALHY